MRILMLAQSEPYIRSRLKEAAAAQGHAITFAKMSDLSFEIDATGQTSAFVRIAESEEENAPHHTAAILTSFDAIAFRHFYPTYISEGLFLAELAASHGLVVVDDVLSHKNFIYNKWYNGWKMAAAGLPVIEGYQAMRTDEAFTRLANVTYPIIIKGQHGGQGRFVFKIENEKALRKTLTENLIGHFLFQKCIPIEHEYRVIVVGGRALPLVMEKIAPEGEFRHNIAVGSLGVGVEIAPELLELCERAARVLGYELSGVDLAISNGKPVIIEANRCPGYEGFEQATGLDVAGAYIAHIAARVTASKSKIVDKIVAPATVGNVTA